MSSFRKELSTLTMIEGAYSFLSDDHFSAAYSKTVRFIAGSLPGGLESRWMEAGCIILGMCF